MVLMDFITLSVQTFDKIIPISGSNSSLIVWILGSANTLLVTILILALTNFNKNFRRLVETVDKIVVINARSDEKIKSLFNSNINIKSSITEIDKRVNKIREDQLKCKSCDIN